MICHSERGTKRDLIVINLGLIIINLNINYLIIVFMDDLSFRTRNEEGSNYYKSGFDYYQFEYQLFNNSFYG